MYKYYIYSTFEVSVSQNKWVEFYPFLECVDWNNIYLLPPKTVIDSNLITLQFKILHRVYACNYKLLQWKIKGSAEWFVCQQIDNIEHYFFCCRGTKYFWNQVEKWLCNLFSMSDNLTVLEVLVGLLILIHTIIMLLIMSSL